MNYLCILFGIMFIYFAYLNLNDIDPWVWVPTYLSAAAICFMAYFKIHYLTIDVILIIYYVVFSFINWPDKWEGVSMPMSHSMNVEKGRESLGLLICAGCVAFSYFAAQ